ncbi:MarR family winged helix-turn-helix transcriptional regulator [Streptomyces hyaluromycini]|uniref:MarR family winged helix-turn-helix transcriptional regulator n=1 Tax=Streptomyces hyaluromycini TaxID=1377993 RepID=UPI000B5CBBE8|nr:MarR family transcriptional regulator [Streptomyces hyaluromycini]
MQNKPTAETAGADQDIEDLGLVDGLAQLSFLVQGVLGKVAAEHGLSVVQLRLLGVLRDRTPGMQELAHHLGLDKSSMTGLVDRAERRDLVRRTPSAHDRRSFLVSITPQGQQLARQCEVLADRQIRGLTAHLTDAQRARLSLLASALVNHHSPL